MAAPDDPILDESAEDLYEHAPCGYFSALLDGTIVKANETLLGWTGYGRDELVGRKRVSELLAPGDRIYYETHYAPLLLMQGEVREIAVELVRADGDRLPVLVNSVLRRDEDGTPRVVRTTVFDARDRRRYERELLRARREADERARAALAIAHVNDGVLLVDADGRVQLVNPAAESILGVSADAVVGLPVAAAIPGWDAVGGRAPLGAPERWPTPVTVRLARGGRDLWLSLAGVDAGDGVVYTFRDVSAQRRLDELRSDVVAVVSHELRTPLAGIYGAARTLAADSGGLAPDVRRQLLDLILEQSERQRRVLDEIALMNRLDEGELELREEVVDLGDLAVRVAGAAGGEERLAVDVRAPVRARCDAASLERALGNLIENAVTYSPAGTPVRVSVEALERWARITVADEGPGIAPSERDLVFERFYRVDPEQRTGVAGLGLGLSVARELVTRMDGRLGILPSARGAAFHIDLPLAGPTKNPA